jgi:uncharacterized membrane protein
MEQDHFDFRGLRIALAGFGVVLAAAALATAGHLADWLLLVCAVAGIGLGWIGVGVHYHDMFKKRQAEAEERRTWILRHGDPDRRDDPAAR